MEISEHAKKRISQRLNLSSDRLADLAIQRGIKAEDTKGSLRRYLDMLNNNGVPVRRYVYNNHTFLFDIDKDVLITVLPLPQKFYRLIHNIKSKA